MPMGRLDLVGGVHRGREPHRAGGHWLRPRWMCRGERRWRTKASSRVLLTEGQPKGPTSANLGAPANRVSSASKTARALGFWELDTGGEGGGVTAWLGRNPPKVRLCSLLEKTGRRAGRWVSVSLSLENPQTRPEGPAPTQDKLMRAKRL